MKSRIRVVLGCVCGMLLAGCSRAGEGNVMNLYYLNPDGNALIQEEYVRLEKEDVEIAAAEILDEMQNPTENKNAQPAIPQSVAVKEIHLNGERLELSFSEEYHQLAKSAEVLLRGAVVQTLVQIPKVTYVSFYVEGQPLEDSFGNLIGTMGAEDFVQNTGSSLKSYQETDLQLYFSNKDGTQLKKEKRTQVHYSSNTSIEKLVVEQLMKGTSSDKRSATIPSTVKLLGVSVKEGICYVNFNSAFLEDGYNQKPEVALYSIVNSIIENGNATKVQILIDGSKGSTYKGTIELSDPLEWRADLIEE